MTPYDPNEANAAMLDITYDYLNALRALVYADLVAQFNSLKPNRPLIEHPGLDFVITEVSQGLDDLLTALED